MIQARDISLSNEVRLDSAIRFIPERNPDLYRLLSGDILLLARGHEHRACLFTEHTQNVLASNVFYIIRPNSESALPAYLAWYLNQPVIQAQLDTASHGTGIGYISRSSVEQLSVRLPPMDVQCRIAATMSLWQRHKVVQTELNQAREQLVQAVCRRAVGEQEGVTP